MKLIHLATFSMASLAATANPANPTPSPPTPAPSSLHLASKHFIGLADDSSDVEFDESSGTSNDDIKFSLKVTKYDILEDHMSSSIKAFAGLHCNGTALPSNILSVYADIPTKEEMSSSREDDGIYALVPVNIDVNTMNIEAASEPYPDYFTAEEEKVTLKFCVMPELGAVDIFVDGAVETTSISYTKVNFVVEINMVKGFGSASATITEDAPEENNQNTQIDYDLSACECDANKFCIPEADIQEKTQNSAAINICISADSNDIIIADIQDMKIEDTASNISYKPVNNFRPNEITEVVTDGGGSKNVMVSTRLVSVFFSELAGKKGGTALLEVTGTALLEFVPNSRRLVTLQGGSNNNEVNNNFTVRKLEKDHVVAAGLGEFKMGIVGIKSRSSRTSGASSMITTSMKAGVAKAIIIAVVAEAALV